MLEFSKLLLFELISVSEFKIAMTSIHIMNFIAINHAKFSCDDVWCFCQLSLSRKIHCCYRLLFMKYSLCEFDWKWSIDSIVVRFIISFCKIHLSYKTIWIFWNSYTILFVALQLTLSKHKRYNCVLIDFLLILSNVNFLSFWFWTVLHSNQTRFVFLLKVVMKFPNLNILLCFVEIVVRSTVDRTVRILIFDVSMTFDVQHQNETIEFIVFEWFLDDLNI